MNKKKLELLNKMKGLSVLGVIKLLIKIQFGGTFMFLFFKFILIGIMMVFLMLAAAGIVQFFEQDNNTLKDMNINWDDYQCTCIHLTPEEIAKVKAGGQVEVDGSNGSGINISGGSVITGAHGKKITDAQLNPYDLPLYDGLTMNDVGWEIQFSGSTDSTMDSLGKQWGTTSEHRAVEGESYENVNYGPDAEMGTKLPITIVDGRMSLAVMYGIGLSPENKAKVEAGSLRLNATQDIQVGRYFDVVFSDGTVLASILGSSKSPTSGEGHLNGYAHGTSIAKNSLLEVVQYVPGVRSDYYERGTTKSKLGYKWIADKARELGLTTNVSDASGIWSYKPYIGNKEITKIVVYNQQYYNKAQGNKAWFKEIGLHSNITNDTTASFGQTGTGTTQSNSGNSGLSTNTALDYDLNSFSISNNANLMVVVEGTGGSNCAVKAFEKSGSTWEERVNTIGVLGENGMNSNRIEGDKTTPVGVFKMNTPFGQADALDGFPSDYIKVDEHDYWSGEDETYNKYVRDTRRVVSGEAIGSSAYAEIYDYAIDSGYNISGTVKKGSALFLHCTKANKVSTAGCVAIPKNDMITIMKLFAQHENNSYIVQGVKGTINSLYDAYNSDGLSPSNYSSTSGSTSSGTNGVQQNTLKYSNGEKISLESTWEYASDSKINTGSATYYTATGETRKNICISVNAGHGCSGGSNVKTKCHPDGTPKVTGGTTEAGVVESPSISSGMTFKDGTSEAVVNLKVAKMLKSELLAMGYDVLMIRDSDDEQLDNIARTVISNNVADAHIAIHFDASEDDKGVFYMAVATGVKNMEPVKSHWQEHNALGENLIAGLVLNGAKKFSSGSMEMDLTQTSYSTIPSIDIELGDRITDYSDASCTIFAKGIATGIEEFFKTHTPSNQAKRGISNISNESGNNSGTTNGGTVNKNLNNLRTKCMMKEEGICGCYISDPSCMCHVLAGEDGVMGTDDDGQISTDEATNNQQSGNGIQIPAERLYTFEEIKSTGSQRVLDSALVTYQQWYNTCRSQYSSDYLYAMLPSKPGYNKWFPDRFDGTHNSRGYRDCSTYASEVVYNMGITSVGYGSTADIVTNLVATGKFAHSTFSTDSLLPGDVVNITGVERYGKKGGAGHVQIFVGWADDSKNSAYWYSWGGNSQVEGYPKNGLIITGPNAFVSNNYRHILRYIGE